MSTHPRATTLGAIAALAAAALATSACNVVPIATLEDSFTIAVTARSGSGDKVKIDFLWIVDNSTSMCEEQVALTENFAVFIETLAELNLDPRVAVTTADVQCEMANPAINSSRGVFNQVPATSFPPSCDAKQIFPCLKDSDCDQLGDPGQWQCKPSLPTVACLKNPNDTINTNCVRRCDSTAPNPNQACIDKLGDPRYVCRLGGCVLPPRTEDCPADLPPFLEGNDQLDLFACLATTGVNQEKCFEYEQGLRGALDAIDPDGPNAAQAQAFLRPDAYLVLIFVSDEDDCSVPTDDAIHEDFYDTCATLPDQNGGGPLIPVSDFINRFKSLKSDPSRVIVAAIGGDAIADAPASKLPDACESIADLSLRADCMRLQYVESKSSLTTCYQQTYICESPVGKADWGSRYAELAAGFGPNGIFTNICAAEGIGPALREIGQTIVSAVSKVCLPKPIRFESSLKVVKILADGTEVLLTGGGVDYTLVAGGEDCRVDGQERQAVVFDDPPVSGEQIVLTYEGDNVLEEL
jgi:hypothetical protein